MEGPVGTELPASRALADQLNVSRNTVLFAYERLTAEAYRQARRAGGTYVSGELHLGPARGVTVSSKQVVIAAGSQAALNLIARLLVRECTRVATANPCYQGAAFLFESFRCELVPVPVNESGMDVARCRGAAAQLVYVTPSHPYPMEFTMALERRLRLPDWAHRTGAYIVEDDYDSDFRSRGAPLTSLVGLDRHGSVICLGTFSKSMGAGLRLGYRVLPEQLVAPARAAKALLDNGHPWLDQAVMAAMIESGGYANHLRLIRQMCRARRARPRAVRPGRRPRGLRIPPPRTRERRSCST